MLHYFLAHAAHHFSRWLPRSHRSRLLVAAAFIGVALTASLVYVLFRPSSTRFCSQPLLDNLICNIGFTLFTTAFALILIFVEPLPCWLKFLFHTFGVASFIEGICTVLMTLLAAECAASTPALYRLSVGLSAVSILSTGWEEEFPTLCHITRMLGPSSQMYILFFLIVGHFWLSNTIFLGMVLNKESRTGICYEVVSCCPCTWHI